MTRRTLLAATAAALATPAGFRAWGREPAEVAVRDEDAEVLAEVQGILARSFIGPIQSSRTPHFLCLSTVPAEHRLRVGNHCEAILAEASDVFARAGLDARRPARRLTVVILQDRETYRRLAERCGVNPDSHGRYDINRRTVFCYLRAQDRQPGRIDWEPTLIDVGHEAMHQACYNSGLLNPQGDIPDCIDEGLAMLGEDSTRESHRMLRHANATRLKELGKSRTGVRISLEEFIASDDSFKPDDLERAYHAYSLAWLLVDTLITDPVLLPRFRAYLKAIASRARKDKSHRVEDARTHLGDLQELGARLSRRLRHLLDHPPTRYNSPRRS